MKPTKHAYAKVWQNRPEDDREDTTITLYDHEDANELNSTPAAPLHLLECHASVNSMNESDTLEHRLTAEPFDPIGLVKTGDFWTPMKPITANPKPVDGIPPVSHYPRRGTLNRPDTTRRRLNGQPENNTEHHRRILETHKNNPNPLSCHNRRQRFKHAGQNRPEHKHQNNRTDILHTLKPKTETQPTFNLTEPNQ